MTLVFRLERVSDAFLLLLAAMVAVVSELSMTGRANTTGVSSEMGSSDDELAEDDSPPDALLLDDAFPRFLRQAPWRSKFLILQSSSSLNLGTSLSSSLFQI